MKKTIYLAVLLLSGLAYSQVGINTTTPKTTMDVSVKRDTDGTISDATQNFGLQAPRLTRAELTANTATYGNDQKGALIYVTDVSGGNTSGIRTNVTDTGYYYFDGSLWQKISAGSSTSSVSKNVTAVQTGNYTALATDDVILLSPNSLGLVLTLPTTGIPIGKTYYISNDHPSFPVLLSPGPRENGVVAAQPSQGTIVMYIGGTGDGSYSVVSGY